jgi:hypothetical protein
MQGQRARGGIASLAHRAVCRACGAGCGGYRYWPGFSVGGFVGQVNRERLRGHVIPFDSEAQNAPERTPRGSPGRALQFGGVILQAGH